MTGEVPEFIAPSRNLARGSRRESYWPCFAAAACSALAWNARPSGLPSEAPGVVADATPRSQLRDSKTMLSTC